MPPLWAAHARRCRRPTASPSSDKGSTTASSWSPKCTTSLSIITSNVAGPSVDKNTLEPRPVHSTSRSHRGVDHQRGIPTTHAVGHADGILAVQLPFSIHNPLVWMAAWQEHQIECPSSIVHGGGVLGRPACGVAHKLHVLRKLTLFRHIHRLDCAFALPQDRHVNRVFTSLKDNMAQSARRRRGQGREAVFHVQGDAGTRSRMVHHRPNILPWHEPILKQEGGFCGPRADGHGGPPIRFRWGGLWGATPECNKGHGASHSLWNDVS